MADKPNPQQDAKAIKKLAAQKKNNKSAGQIDSVSGRDTRASRDGGTTRRTWLGNRKDGGR